jgi:hypothetical protein
MNFLTAGELSCDSSDRDDAAADWAANPRRVTYRVAKRGLDLAAAEAALIRAAATRRINLGDLTMAAGRHFRGLTLTSAPPASASDLETLATDELWTTGG